MKKKALEITWRDILKILGWTALLLVLMIF